jgi:hypothetical protein
MLSKSTFGCSSGSPHRLLDLREVTNLDHPGLDTLLAIQAQLIDGFATLELLEPTTGVLAAPARGPPQPATG